MAKKLVIPIPEDGYSRELLRVFGNEVHGELVTHDWLVEMGKLQKVI